MVEIDELITRFREGFLHLDAAMLSSIWADENILYSPVELADPITSKTDLDSYYKKVAELFRDVDRMDLSSIHLNRLSDNSVVAYFRFRFAAHFHHGHPHEVSGRSTIVFRRAESRWYGVHYHESLDLNIRPAQS
jgi:ketosteroid isomerase-like protein